MKILYIFNIITGICLLFLAYISETGEIEKMIAYWFFLILFWILFLQI